MKTELLRFDGAAEHDPAIHAWFQKHEGELGSIAHRWFNVMRNSGDEVLEPVGCRRERRVVPRVPPEAAAEQGI